MKRFRVALLSTASAVVMAMSFASPAQASHTCGLEDVPIVGPVCDGYHSPKLVIQYLAFCAQYPDSCL